MCSFVTICLCLLASFTTTQAFQATPSFPLSSRIHSSSTTPLCASSSSHEQQQVDENAPQVFASGYSPKLDLLEAIQEATEIALQALPRPSNENVAIDLGIITVSSLYDGQSQPSIVVPALLQSASVYGKGLLNIVGCTTGGIIASTANYNDASVVDDNSGEDDNDDTVQQRACSTIESEGVPGVSVTLCLLPDVNVKVRPACL